MEVEGGGAQAPSWEATNEASTIPAKAGFQEIRAAQASGIYTLEVVNEDNGVEKTVEIIRRSVAGG